ncbi:MAG: hypothetical protein WDW38_009540 [Sanguina aurantia]
MFVSKLSYVDLHNLLASKGFKKKAGTESRVHDAEAPQSRDEKIAAERSKNCINQEAVHPAASGHRRWTADAPGQSRTEETETQRVAAMTSHWYGGASKCAQKQRRRLYSCIGMCIAALTLV